MMSRPPGLRQRAVGGIADQQVAEAVGLIACEARLVGAYDVAAHEHREAALEEAVRHLGGELADRAEVELRALHRGQHEHGTFIARKSLQPVGEQRVDRRRHLDVEEAVGRHPAAAVPAEQVVVDEQREQLLGEQRVAVGGPGDPRRGVGRQGPAPEQVGDELPAVAVAERLEQQGVDVEPAAAPAGTGIHELGPRKPDEQDRRVAREVGEVFDQPEERRLGPLQVVEDDHERPALRERLEELAHGPRGRLAGAGPGGAEAERLEDQLADQLGLLLAGHEGRDRRARRLRPRSARAQDLLHDLGQRPVGDALAVGQAVAVQHRRLRAELVRELLHETRLADAGRPDDRQQVARPVLDDPREGVAQRGQRPLAADERRVEAARGGGEDGVACRLGRAEDSLLHHPLLQGRVAALCPCFVPHGSTDARVRRRVVRGLRFRRRRRRDTGHRASVMRPRRRGRRR